MRALIVACCLMGIPLGIAAKGTTHFYQEIHHIDAKELKSWYDQSVSMVILDARSQKYFDGNLLPGALWLPSESSEEEIRAAVPSTSSLIVVYCANTKCPASGWLAEKLVQMGYTNVYEYSEGIADWMRRGYPTVKQH